MRLAEVRAERDRQRLKWHETRCKRCGATIKYHEDWSRIPHLCKPCRELEKASWREKPCRGCGEPIRYNIEWAHSPNYCKSCKARAGSGKN